MWPYNNQNKIIKGICYLIRQNTRTHMDSRNLALDDWLVGKSTWTQYTKRSGPLLRSTIGPTTMTKVLTVNHSTAKPNNQK